MSVFNDENVYGPLTDDANLGLRLANLQATKDLVETFRSHELTPAQFAALTLLHTHQQLPMGELGRLLLIQKPNLTAMLTPLLERGLVTREQHQHDRRQRLLRLAPSGRALLAKAEAARLAHVARVVAFMGEEEYSRLTQLLKRLAQYEAPA